MATPLQSKAADEAAQRRTLSEDSEMLDGLHSNRGGPKRASSAGKERRNSGGGGGGGGTTNRGARRTSFMSRFTSPSKRKASMQANV